ncbi:hypothetical protein SOM70_37500 [Streptomyces salinarius]|uniref:hypothetical protein n=1 Tax=Streptomyces salinarius TaxID=2762598 RepID=UPI0032DE964D
MSEWGIALIAAGSAVAGSIVTGWFTRSAGYRQAEAARHAGNRQADALITTVRATLDEQRTAREVSQRREVYIQFLQAAETVRSAYDQQGGGPTARGRGAGAGPSEADIAALQRALATVKLENASDAAAGYAINDMADRVVQLASESDVHVYHNARQWFLNEAHAAIVRTTDRASAR